LLVILGWEPGAPEGAMDWDEDWDKFEDEGDLYSVNLLLNLSCAAMCFVEGGSHGSDLT
jgi:hypothetical protein